MQDRANNNPALFYNALKNPAANLPIIQSQSMRNELSTLADSHTMVLYLPTTNLQSAITQLGLTQVPQLEEQWTLTMPLGTVTIDFLPELARIVIPAELLKIKSSPSSLQSLTIQTVENTPLEKKLPIVVFGLPVQRATTLTIGNNSIVAAKPNQVAELITQLFFHLLEKGKKIEEARAQIPVRTTPSKQKASPTMRKIVGLPTIPEVRKIKKVSKPFTIKITKPAQKIPPQEFKPEPQRSFISPRIASPRLPAALQKNSTKIPLKASSKINKG